METEVVNDDGGTVSESRSELTLVFQEVGSPVSGDCEFFLWESSVVDEGSLLIVLIELEVNEGGVVGSRLGRGVASPEIAKSVTVESAHLHEAELTQVAGHLVEELVVLHVCENQHCVSVEGKVSENHRDCLALRRSHSIVTLRIHRHFSCGVVCGEGEEDPGVCSGKSVETFDSHCLCSVFEHENQLIILLFFSSLVFFFRFQVVVDVEQVVLRPLLYLLLETVGVLSDCLQILQVFISSKLLLCERTLRVRGRKLLSQESIASL